MEIKKEYCKKEETCINKLVLIGNGFDRAVGLKTSYEDFLLWLLKKYILIALKSGGKQNAPFDKYKGNYNSFRDQHSYRVIFGYSENILFDILINKRNVIDEKSLADHTDLKSILDLLNSKLIEIVPHISEGLFAAILNQSGLGWVDIEGIYYNLLVESIKLENDEIDQLNLDLIHIKEYLEEYLTSVELDETHFDVERNKFINQFFNGITREEILDAKKDDLISTGITYFLNFNYTDTLSTLVNGFKFKTQTEYEINHIHGKLNSENQPIIFGFGDEMDVHYKKIEELKDNRYFENIKSFKYLKNGNFRSLIRFLDSENYQVNIYGHSCGLSDRIMLNEIFEHENCKSIKIFHFDDKEGFSDYTNKTMEISRHFNSNKLMRKKIVEFNPENKIPQINKIEIVKKIQLAEKLN